MATALLFAGVGFGQGTQIQNDCIVGFGISSGFSLTGAGANVQFSNQRYGCFDWRVIYFVDGFSAISLVVQSAPDSAGNPGSWSTFVGTVIDGVNPNTATTFASTRLTGSPPWVRVLLNTVTGSGSVTGVLYGCKQPGCSTSELTSSSGGSACVGTTAKPCVVAGTDAPGAASTQNPVQVAGNDGTDVRAIATDSAGDTKVVGAAAVGSAVKAPVTTGARGSTGNALNDFVCDQQAAISITTSGLVQIATGNNSQTTRICHIDFALSASSNFTIEYGTGTNCGTGTGSLSGTYPAVLTFAADYNERAPLTIFGNNVCLNVVSSVTGGGFVTYAVF